MVAYLPAECRETEAACGLVENSGADVRAANAMVGRQNPVLDIELGLLTWRFTHSSSNTKASPTVRRYVSLPTGLRYDVISIRNRS